MERRRQRWHTHARGVTHSLSASLRARDSSLVVSVRRKNNTRRPFPFWSPPLRLSHEGSVLSFSHTFVFSPSPPLPPSLSLSFRTLSLRRGRTANKRTSEIKKKINSTPHQQCARFTVWCAARTGAYIFRNNSQMLQRRRARYGTCKCCSVCFTHETPLSLSRRVSGR